MAETTVDAAEEDISTGVIGHHRVHHRHTFSLVGGVASCLGSRGSLLIILFHVIKGTLPLLCYVCQLGKHVCLSFKLSKTNALFPFQIIHSEVWTSLIQSHSGINYYVIFLDQFTHFVWVYPLRNKSEVLSKFLHFRAYTENQFLAKIQTFQCDNGEEYEKSNFHQL